MNYKGLQIMVDSLIENYKCECGEGITAENVDIMGAAGNNVNIDVVCSKCGKHSMMKSQLLVIKPENISTLKDNLLNIKENINMTKIENSIKDKEIIDLSKDLKNDISVADLFE